MPKIYKIENAKELFFQSKEEYLALRTIWKAAAHAKSLTAQDMAAYALLRGRDLRRGFTTISNKNKLANGQMAHNKLEQAYADLRILQCRVSAMPRDLPALIKLSAFVNQHCSGPWESYSGPADKLNEAA